MSTVDILVMVYAIMVYAAAFMANVGWERFLIYIEYNGIHGHLKQRRLATQFIRLFMDCFYYYLAVHVESTNRWIQITVLSSCTASLIVTSAMFLVGCL